MNRGEESRSHSDVGAFGGAIQSIITSRNVEIFDILSLSKSNSFDKYSIHEFWEYLLMMIKSLNRSH